MRIFLLATILALASPVAGAKGVPFAIKSLEQAEQVVRQDSGKHVLVFFTSET